MGRFKQYLEGVRVSHDGVNFVDASSVKTRRMKDRGNFPKYEEFSDGGNTFTLIGMYDLRKFFEKTDYASTVDSLDQKAQKIQGEGSDASDEYVRTGIMMKQWAKENNAHYYGAPHSSFSKLKAIKQAQDAGKRIVILDDMS